MRAAQCFSSSPSAVAQRGRRCAHRSCIARMPSKCEIVSALCGAMHILTRRVRRLFIWSSGAREVRGVSSLYIHWISARSWWADVAVAVGVAGGVVVIVVGLACDCGTTFDDEMSAC